MKLAVLLVASSLALFAFAVSLPSAAAAPSAPCINTGSQWKACYTNGCLIVDGPAFHEEYCFGQVIGEIDFCIPTGLQGRGLCVAPPCVSFDGPATHVQYCIPPMQTLA